MLTVCDALLHGDETPPKPLTTGFVALLFKDPKGDERSGSSFGLSLSSACLLVDVSFKSVLRRSKDGGGVVVFGSSRKKRVPPVGDLGTTVES